MEELIKVLHEGGYSCVIEQGGVRRTFTRRGVADLFELLNNDKGFLGKASIADKVVGKAAASLMSLGGIGSLNADVLSEPALRLLNKYGIPTTYGILVPNIINRAGTDWCPLERLCYDAQTAEECYERITEFMNEHKK